MLQHLVEQLPAAPEFCLGEHRPGHLAAQPMAAPAQLQLADHLSGEHRQVQTLLLAEFPGNGVQHAQRPDPDPVGHHQRRAGVEAEAAHRGDQRAVAESLVQGSVRHHQHGRGLQRMEAERGVPGDFGLPGAPPGLEPQPVGVQQTDQRDRGAAQAGRQCGQIVEVLLVERVQDAELAEHPEPAGIVLRRLGVGAHLGPPAGSDLFVAR